MGLGRYAKQCRELAQEIVDSVSEADVNVLRCKLAHVSKGAWWDWRDRNEPIVEAFVAATPSQRRKKKVFHEPDIKGFVDLAAYQHCLEAHVVLDVISRANLHPGPSYREIAAKASRYYWEMLYTKIPLWPFEPPSPFDPK